MMSIN